MSVLPGALWFLGKSTLSTIVVLAAIKFRTKVSMFVVSVETLFIAVTLWALIGWNGSQFTWAYDNYEHLLTIACITEALILTLGAPWLAIFKRISRLFSHGTDDHTAYRVSHSFDLGG